MPATGGGRIGLEGGGSASPPRAGILRRPPRLSAVREPVDEAERLPLAVDRAGLVVDQAGRARSRTPRASYRWVALADCRSENDPADERDDQSGNDTGDRRLRDEEHSIAHERTRNGDAQPGHPRGSPVGRHRHTLAQSKIVVPERGYQTAVIRATSRVQISSGSAESRTRRVARLARPRMPSIRDSEDADARAEASDPSRSCAPGRSRAERN